MCTATIIGAYRIPRVCFAAHDPTWDRLAESGTLRALAERGAAPADAAASMWADLLDLTARP